MSEKKTCGTCEHWEPQEGKRVIGDCFCPTPMSLSAALRSLSKWGPVFEDMRSDADASACKCYTPKEVEP